MSVELLNRLGDAWSRQDIDGVMETFADDATFHAAFGSGPLGTSCHGKAAIRAAIQASFEAYPGSTLEGIGVPCLGTDGQASSQWVFHYTGPDGKKASLHGCDLFQLEKGKIKVKNAYIKMFVEPQA